MVNFLATQKILMDFCDSIENIATFFVDVTFINILKI